MTNACRLCRVEDDRPLRRSHIVPEFLHANVYEQPPGKNRRASIVSSANERRGTIQKGLREKLLCDDCEQFLSREYENPFSKMWRRPGVVPEQMSPEAVHLVDDFDYRTAKLLLLSILWRASVSTLDTYQVELGRHADVIRRMVLNGDPGDPSLYPIVGTFVVNPEDDNRLVPTVGPPFRYRILGHNAWVMSLDTCEWAIFVTSHQIDILAAALRDTNRVVFGAQTWAETRTMDSMRFQRARWKSRLKRGNPAGPR